MLKYIFAAIFIALAWAVVLVFHDVVPMWPAIVATAVIGGGLLVYLLVRALLAKQRRGGHREGPQRSGARRWRGGFAPISRPRSPPWRPSSRARSRRSRARSWDGPAATRWACSPGT